jgi:hypothetical protein
MFSERAALKVSASRQVVAPFGLVEGRSTFDVLDLYSVTFVNARPSTGKL